MMSKPSNGDRIKLVVLMLTVMLLLITAGCTTQPEVQSTDPKKPPISSKPIEQKEKVKLYFSDEQALFLKPEVREVTIKGEPLAEIVVKELIKGPTEEGLKKTVPPETELRSLQVEEGVAYLNLSKEVQTKHWGGTTGEMMTVYSIVNTLTDLNIGIEKVQFLVEGEKQETLVGHLSTFEPIAPDWFMTKTGEIWLGAVDINIDKLRELQQQVDEGHQPWYLDPLQVAMETSTRYGFDPRVDKFTLVKVEEMGEYVGTGLAYVEATHDGKDYTIELIQPVEQGATGVWTINSITLN
ncbi:GerMN domain-containing protein [Peptococcaceae bacterium 1198_IL3148]